METIGKRQLTEKDRERLNKTFLMLKKGCTKMELATHLGLTGAYSTVERVSRDYIATVAKDYPVISTSSAGSKYCLALHYEIDADKAQQTVNELQSKIKEINKRLKPLQRFLQLAKQGRQGMVDWREWKQWLQTQNKGDN